MRIAVFNAELSASGPGRLYSDILSESAEVTSAVSVITVARPDVLLLMGIDWDADLFALRAFAGLLDNAGHAMPHVLAPRPNDGVPTGRDLDRDGRLAEPEDAQGYGMFEGQGAMALLARVPLDTAGLQDFTGLLWRDLPGAQLPQTDAGPYFDADDLAILRLASSGQWTVPLAETGLTLMAIDAAPPVFDGPEDRNGARNADQIRLLQKVLDGNVGRPPEGDFVILGNLNLDPERGQGRRDVVRALLRDPRLRDPRPRDDAGRLATADWRDPVPGDLRVDYVLPSAGLGVLDAGVLWPQDVAGASEGASRHALVWVDIVP